MSSEIVGRIEAMEQRLEDEWSPRAAGATDEERATVGRPVAPAASGAGTRPRRLLRRALSSRRALREAILLREVLGTPKALQRPED